MPIEIKLGQTVTQKNLVTLKTFLAENNLPLGLVVNQADEVHFLSENILQVPVQCLV